MLELKSPRGKLYLRILLRAILFTACILAVVIIGPRLLTLFAPFVAAYIIALMLNPVVSKLNQRLKMPRRLTTLILILLVFFGLTSLIGWLVYLLVSQAISMASNLQSIWDYVLSALSFVEDKLTWLARIMPQETDMALEGVFQNVYQWLLNSSKSLLNSVAATTVSVTTKIGNGIVGFVVCVMATYFTTADFQRIKEILREKIGKRIYGHFRSVKNAVTSAIGGYFKAQLLIALLAFAVMFVALLIYRQEYAFLIALFMAFLDFLPIVGCAALLIPWAVVALLNGDIIQCIFLVVLAVIWSFIRRFAEPKIVGSQMGLPPLVALMSTYAGLRACGLLGAILGPIVVLVVINIVKTGIFRATGLDLRDAAHDLANFLHRETPAINPEEADPQNSDERPTRRHPHI